MTPADRAAEHNRALDEMRRQREADEDADPLGHLDTNTRAQLEGEALDRLERMQRWQADKPDSLAAKGATVGAAARWRRTLGKAVKSPESDTSPPTS